MEIYFQSRSTIRLNLGVDADIVGGDHQVYITITRMSDSVVILSSTLATRDSLGIYSHVLTESRTSPTGLYKATWVYTIGAETTSKDIFYNVIVGYFSSDAFRAAYPELSSETDTAIYRKEALARKIIDSVCNQSFDFEQNKQYKMFGDYKNTLFLPKRIWQLDNVLAGGSDITSEVEIFDDQWIVPSNLPLSPSSILEDIKKDISGDVFRYFRKNLVYLVTGNWGWQYVPEDISLAAKMLAYDYYNDDTIYHQHGVIAADMGDRRLQWARNKLEWDSTGNYDVDVILGNYVNISMRLI